MATVVVDSNGNANDPTVPRDGLIQWVLDAGVVGPFALYLPHSILVNSPGCFTLSSSTSSAGPYQVKHGASVGKHNYDIEAGACPPTKGHKHRTGTQKITVT
jgi:hypothetical protein